MLSIRPKEQLFGCPPPPAPNFEKLEKSFAVQKYTPLIPKEFFNRTTKIWTELSQAQLDLPTDH